MKFLAADGFFYSTSKRIKINYPDHAYRDKYRLA